MGGLAEIPSRRRTGQRGRAVLLQPSRAPQRGPAGPAQRRPRPRRASRGRGPGRSAPAPPGAAGGQPGAARGGPVDPGGCRRGGCAGHVRGPVPRRHRLHQPDHLGGVDRPHPAAGRPGARRPGAGRDLARAARHHRAGPGQRGGRLQRRVPDPRRPRRLLPRRPPGRARSSPGRRRWSSTPTGGSISGPGGARSA